MSVHLEGSQDTDRLATRFLELQVPKLSGFRIRFGERVATSQLRCCGTAGGVLRGGAGAKLARSADQFQIFSERRHGQEAGYRLYRAGQDAGSRVRLHGVQRADV